MSKDLPTNALAVVSEEGPYEQLRRELTELEEAALPLVSGTPEAQLVEYGYVRRALLLLERLRRGSSVEENRLHRELYEMRRKLEPLEEKNRLLKARVLQLETIVQTAFSRAVRGLSADRPQAQRQAEEVTRMLTDALEAERLLDERGVPGTGLAARVRTVLAVGAGGARIDFDVEAEAEVVAEPGERTEIVIASKD